MRPPKLAIKTAIGVLIAAAILVMGAVSASAAPNPGYGTPGSTIVQPQAPSTPAVINPAPSYPSTNEPTEDGPQTSNVPTLAWVGEEVKLVACDDNILPLPYDGLYEQAVFSIENWTGDQAFQPTFNGSTSSNIYINNQGSSSFFFPSGYEAYYKGCVSADVKSLHAGLSVVKLDVAAQCIGGYYEVLDTSNGQDGQDPCSGETVQVYSEQFIVIWMTANAPTLTEASVSSLSTPGTPGTDAAATPGEDQLSPEGVSNATAFLGDPTGNGVFGADGWGWDVPWGDCQVASANNDDNSSCDVSNDTPNANNGLVDIRVTGSFPVEDQPPATTNLNEFGSIDGGTNPGSITLPNQWAALASKLATSSTSNTAITPNLWDIHGGPTNSLTHVAAFKTTCHLDGSVFTGSLDAVDSCATNDGVHGNPFSFSRVFGDFTNFGTVGPYDDEAPNATLLSDGRLNSDDAPMPSLPITVSIEPNSAVAGNEPAQEMATVPTASDTLGGVGGLYGVEKWLVYSHDFDTSSTTLHGHHTNYPAGNGAPIALTNGDLGGTAGEGNLYNPFYQSYIPSTTRNFNESSGVDGVYDYGFPGSSGDDFPGFSNGYTSPYTYWKALDNTSADAVNSTDCLRRDDNTDPLGGPNVYNEPYYPTNATVYTDERGEAVVDYNPGTGFYLNNLNISLDKNNACDLQALLGKEIGSSTIVAQTEYPYQSVPYTAPAGANTLTKVVNSKWSKTLTAYPKGNLSSPNPAVSIFVAQATDINGQPFQHEEVCFSSSPETAMSQYFGKFTGVSGPVDTTDSTDAPAPGTGYTCAYTGALGQAAVEVPSSTTGIDVVAWFVNEHIFRDVTTTLGDPTPVSSNNPPTVIPSDPVVFHTGTAGSSSSSAGSSTSAPSATVAPTTPLSTVGAGNSCKVNSLHMYAKKGYVQVKVSCTKSKTDSIVLRTFKANGKLVHSYRKTIAAGKTVRIRLSLHKVAHVSVLA